MIVSYDRVADIYDETRRIPDLIAQEFYRTVLQKTRIAHNSIILDAGIGTGRATSHLLAHGVRAVGVDISRNMLQKLIEKTKRKNILSSIFLTVGDVTSLPFRDSSFDLVIAVHILHLVNLKRFVSEARRVLKSDGCLVVGASSVGQIQSCVGQKYMELLDHYVDNEKNLRSFIWKCFFGKIYKIKFFGHLLDIVKKYINWVTFLKNNARSVETRIIKWEERHRSSDVLRQLKDRTFSFQWAVPVETHKEIMSRLRDWIFRQRGSHFIEKIERRFKIIIVKF